VILLHPWGGKLSADRYAEWRELGQQLRIDSIRSTAAAGSGHPTSSMSAADVIAVLLSKYLRYDFDHPGNPANDHLIFSKGHAAPLLYALYKAAGAISDEELLTLRRFGSPLQGHPTPALPWVDVATGSLGQGLPIGAGIALAAKSLDGRPCRVWVLCGDGELAEGSMWEAFDYAAHMRLDNLTAIIDANGLAQLGDARHGLDPNIYMEQARAFGWHAVSIDGHDFGEIDDAYAAATDPDCTAGRPTAIIARTRKGKGVAAIEGKLGFHSRPLDDPEAAIRELGGPRNLRVEVAKPSVNGAGGPVRTGRTGSRASQLVDGNEELPGYKVGSQIAVRSAFGEALAALGRFQEDVVVVDAEVATATYVDRFAAAHPGRYFKVSIAEQQMVGRAANGCDRDWPTGPWLDCLRGDVRRIPIASLRFCPHGRSERRHPSPRGVARWSFHWTRGTVANGSRRSRAVSGSLRQRRPLSVRREPDKPARRSHGRAGWHLLPPVHASDRAGDL
jgi:transketolase